MPTRIAIAVATLLCLAVCSLAPAADPAGQTAEWPQWQGPNRDNRSPDTGLLKQWPDGGPKLLLTIPGVGEGYSSPSISGGLIYTTGVIDGKQVVKAFDMDGTKKWEADNGPAFRGQYPGSRSTATIADGRVYVFSGIGQAGCFDATTGHEVWTLQVAKKTGGRVPTWGFAESLLIEGDKVICTPGGKDATVVALNAKTGRPIWQSEGLSDRAAYCSPVVTDLGKMRMITTMTVSGAVGLDAATGRPLWAYPHKTNYDVNATTPVVVGDEVYGTSGYGAGGFKLKLSASGSRVSAKQEWIEKKLDDHHGGVVLVDGYIYGSGDQNGRYWVCLDFATGDVKYVAPGVGKGSLTYADGMLYCLSERGTMGLAKADPSKHEVISQFRVPKGGGGSYWAHPVVIGGRLYLRHADKLFIYDVKGEQGAE
jgi:outer membrane protein assembly factor BamB